MSSSLQLEPRPAGEHLVTSQVIIQRNLYGIWVLDREARSKNKRQFSKASSLAAPPMCLPHSWRGEWRQHKAFLLEYPHHHRKRVRIG